MKAKLAIFFLTLLFVFGKVSAEDTWECPDGYEGQTLDVLNWFQYVAENTVADFEAACHVTVNYVEYDDEYFMYDTLKLGNAPNYDLVVASSTMVSRLLADELLGEIDHEQIPNISNISADFLSLEHDPENNYSLPYMWGAVGIGYRRASFPDGLSSWDDLWNYEGSVAWIDDKRAMLGIGLLSLGFDPNTKNAGEILAARDYLGERGTNLVGIYGLETIEMIPAGTVDAAIIYSGVMGSIISTCKCDDYSFVIPEEGSNIYLDNMVIPADASHPQLAQVFMDYLLDPYINAEVSNLLAVGSTNQAALELEILDTSNLERFGINISNELLEKMFYIEVLDDETSVYYDVAWDELMNFYMP